MPSTYVLATEQTKELLAQVRAEYHHRLDDSDVRIGVLMAVAGVDKRTGERTGPAIKGYAGAAAAAHVKKVPLKDRLTKGYDVEMLLDGDEWPKLGEAEQLAILDHECTHIQTTGKVDDLGRPLVKMREEDFIAWGFWEVIQRHGRAAMEHRALKILADKHGQLLMNLPGFSDAGSVTISAPGSKAAPVTMSQARFSQIGQEINAQRRQKRRTTKA